MVATPRQGFNAAVRHAARAFEAGLVDGSHPFVASVVGSGKRSVPAGEIQA
jgi:hypothetical protein